VGARAVVDIGPADGYIREHRTLYKVQTAGDAQVQLVFRASNMRLEKTGFHARVEISANGTPIAFNTFNVERDGDRVTLANSAYRQLSPSGELRGEGSVLPGYPSKFLKNDLDRFCGGLQDAHLASLSPGWMAGSLERREPPFLVRPYLLDEGGTILFAAPGLGKSYILWLLAVCLDAGLNTLWPIPRAVRVLVVNLERSQRSVEDRLGNINQVLGQNRARPIQTLNARGRHLEALAPTIQRYVENEGIEVVLLDSLSRAGRGSLNDDEVMNAHCDTLNSFEAAWLALAHSPRGDATHAFGSQMQDAAADLMVRLTSQSRMNGTMGIALEVPKKNDVGPQPLWIGCLSFDHMGLTGVRRARAGEFAELEGNGEAALPAEERVKRYLIRVGPRSATAVAKDLDIGRSSVSVLFNSAGVFTAVGKEGKEVLYDVVESGRVLQRVSGSNTSYGQAELTRAEHEEDDYGPEGLPL
jgi:hypothetical protein